jgi:hypothetical protein
MQGKSGFLEDSARKSAMPCGIGTFMGCLGLFAASRVSGQEPDVPPVGLRRKVWGPRWA